jgi:hypothetical protein
MRSTGRNFHILLELMRKFCHYTVIDGHAYDGNISSPLLLAVMKLRERFLVMDPDQKKEWDWLVSSLVNTFVLSPDGAAYVCRGRQKSGDYNTLHNNTMMSILMYMTIVAEEFHLDTTEKLKDFLVEHPFLSMGDNMQFFWNEDDFPWMTILHRFDDYFGLSVKVEHHDDPNPVLFKATYDGIMETPRYNPWNLWATVCFRKKNEANLEVAISRLAAARFMAATDYDNTVFEQLSAIGEQACAFAGSIGLVIPNGLFPSRSEILNLYTGNETRSGVCGRVSSELQKVLTEYAEAWQEEGGEEAA